MMMKTYDRLINKCGCGLALIEIINIIIIGVMPGNVPHEQKWTQGMHQIISVSVGTAQAQTTTHIRGIIVSARLDGNASRNSRNVKVAQDDVI